MGGGGSIGVGDLDASGLPQAQAPWEGRAIATHKFRLLEFSAYMELQKEDIVSCVVAGLDETCEVVILQVYSYNNILCSITSTCLFSLAASHRIRIPCLK